MARRGQWKGKRGGVGRHVQLSEYLQQTEAWATLKPGPRALYIELKRRYNGCNNGNIILSHRDAAAALNIHRNTVGAWFQELQERQLITMMEGPCLGSEGVGKAALWALNEAPLADGRSAKKGFERWRQSEIPAQNPGSGGTNVVTLKAKSGLACPGAPQKK